MVLAATVVLVALAVTAVRVARVQASVQQAKAETVATTATEQPHHILPVVAVEKAVAATTHQTPQRLALVLTVKPQALQAVQ
jgi:uncharacterized membrane protein YgdD (TMEM256/DUF423 family)